MIHAVPPVSLELDNPQERFLEVSPGSRSVSTLAKLKEDSLATRILLSTQRALLGAVPPRLRGVTVGWADGVIQIRSYFDGPISEEDQEAMSCVATEVIADFPDPWTISEEVIRTDAPGPMACLKAWAYLRRE